jgi:hypothetical protein
MMEQFVVRCLMQKTNLSNQPQKDGLLFGKVMKSKRYNATIKIIIFKSSKLTLNKNYLINQSLLKKENN